MKQIETEGSRYPCTELFDAVVDTAKLRSETVGRDEAGNLILHVSETCNMSSAYSSEETYFLLTPEEYRDYVETARKNGLIRRWDVKRLLREAGEPPAPAGKIVSFETVTLRVSGMRYVMEYELLPRGDGAEVTKYGIRFSGEEDLRVPERHTVCSLAEALKLLNSVRLLSWDGFHGPHPKGVRDGTMFTLEATVNGGRRIRATGSQNFPRHYRDFTDGLRELLDREQGGAAPGGGEHR